jgi:hypothetical protein
MWRDRVKIWLQRIGPLATWPNNWSQAVQGQQQSFAQSLLVKFVKLIARSWAKWLIKDALQNASKDLGLGLTAGDAGALADILVEVV